MGFVGFESISHSAAEAKFSLKKSFGVLAVAVITATIAYVFLSLMAVKALPDGCNSWTDYIANLGDYSGEASQPTFHAAYALLGRYRKSYSWCCSTWRNIYRTDR